MKYNDDVRFGSVTASAGDFAYRALVEACKIKPKYIVTAPTSKESMYLAGHCYNGQTEVLEKMLAHDGQKAEMLFVANDFRVLLLTRHCALKDVSSILTKEFIVEKIARVNKIFQTKFNIEHPAFALCGLNPHCGENSVIE